MKITQSQLRKIIREELEGAQGQAEFKKLRNAMLAASGKDISPARLNRDIGFAMGRGTTYQELYAMPEKKQRAIIQKALDGPKKAAFKKLRNDMADASARAGKRIPGPSFTRNMNALLEEEGITYEQLYAMPEEKQRAIIQKAIELGPLDDPSAERRKQSPRQDPFALREVDAPMEEANENIITIHGAMEYIDHVQGAPQKFTEEIKASLLRRLKGADNLQNLLARINEKGVDYTKNPAYQTIAAAAAAQKDNNMKITESQLRKIIKEELSALGQSYTDPSQVKNALKDYFSALPGGQALDKSDTKLLDSLLDTLSAQVAAGEITLNQAKAKLSKSKGIEFEAPMEEAEEPFTGFQLPDWHTVMKSFDITRKGDGWEIKNKYGDLIGDGTFTRDGVIAFYNKLHKRAKQAGGRIGSAKSGGWGTSSPRGRDY